MNEMTPPLPELDHKRSDRTTDMPQDPRVAHKRRRGAIWLSGATACVLALMVGWGVWTHFARASSAAAALSARQEAVPLVRTMNATAEKGPGMVDLPGTMQPFDAATLYARATGYIATRNVDIGSHVHAGDVLVVIAAPDLDQQLAQARAQLAQMQAALLQAQAGRSLADVTNRRTSRMVIEGWNSRQQGDQDRSNLITQGAGVRVAQANIAAQVAQVNRLVELTGFERVKAPFDGVITSRQVDVGTLVTADQSSGSALFSIAKTDVLRVQVYVPQEYFFALRDGEGATVTVPQLPGRVFHGTVARNAGALATDTRTLLAEIDVDNRDQALSPGLYGIVHLEQRRDKPVVSVPSEAIIFGKNGLSAAVVEDGRVVLRQLNVLTDDGAQVQVQDGVKPGDQIILSPPVNITQGMRVRTS
jgi:RND family efflux transporter MFP subunit